MTLANRPLQLDGALITSSLVRKGLYAAVGSEGVVEPKDFIVSPSSPAGQSLRVSGGLAAVLNRYQSAPDELYVVQNGGIHNITSADMPGSSPGTTYWLVCLVVGDPQSGYSQTDHPFMPSDFDTSLANTFEYNRFVLLPCSASTTKFSELGKPYPGLALARIALPSSTTTVTSGMITDLRVVAGAPELAEVALGGDFAVAAGSFNTIPSFSYTIASPGPKATYRIDLNAHLVLGSLTEGELSLLVDGAAQTAKLVGKSTNIATNLELPGHHSWILTGLAAGNRTITVRARATGANGIIVKADNTTLVVERKS